MQRPTSLQHCSTIESEHCSFSAWWTTMKIKHQMVLSMNVFPQMSPYLTQLCSHNTITFSSTSCLWRAQGILLSQLISQPPTTSTSLLQSGGESVWWWVHSQQCVLMRSRSGRSSHCSLSWGPLSGSAPQSLSHQAELLWCSWVNWFCSIQSAYSLHQL